jgi:hypothetical protein
MAGGIPPEEGPKVSSESLSSSGKRNRFPRLSSTSPVTTPPLQSLRIIKLLLTHSMVQSPSWTADWLAVSQEISRISRNPKVHYRTHKRTPPVSILGQPNLVHTPTSHLLEIHPNIIHPSTPRSPSDLFHSGFPTKTLYTPLSSPIRALIKLLLLLLLLLLLALELLYSVTIECLISRNTEVARMR